MKKKAYLVLSILVFFIIIVRMPIIKAQNAQVDDISLSMNTQSPNVGDLIKLNVDSTNEEDTKVFIPLSVHVQYQGFSEGSGSVHYDEINHQVIIDWGVEGTKNANLGLVFVSEGHFSTKAYSRRGNSGVESAPIYIQSNHQEMEEPFEDSSENGVTDSTDVAESLIEEQPTANSPIEDSEENLGDKTKESETIKEESSSQVTGTWGNVSWQWDEATATITLQDGNAGTAATAPWKTYTEVQRIVAEGTVVLQPMAFRLFSDLQHLVYFEGDNFDTSQVTNMQRMFDGCSSIEKLDLGSWNTSNVVDVSYLFVCSSLRELNISGWDLTNTNNNGSNYWFIFLSPNLERVTLGENSHFSHWTGHPTQPRFPNVNPAPDVYTGNWNLIKDQDGNEVTERIIRPISRLISVDGYDGSNPGTYVLERWRRMTINYLDSSLNVLQEQQEIRGGYFEEYEVESDILGWELLEHSRDLSGKLSEETMEINLIYRLKSSSILDPINPEEEMTPEYKPDLPEELGSVRIDYAPVFSFGTQKISNQNKEYYAETLKIDGSNEERPNFVQISNFDPHTTAWRLSVRQERQFHTADGKELFGASLSYKNAELISVHSQTASSEYHAALTLTPGESSDLINAEEGHGTWIYRFGNLETKDSSIVLNVPRYATPSAEKYYTTLNWTLAIIP